MNVPSGRLFREGDLQLLRLMVKYGFIRWSDEPFTLRSGIKSHIYVFGREDLTDNPDLEWAVGNRIAEAFVHERRDRTKHQCLIGLPTAGTSLAQAAAMVGHRLGYQPPICHRIMREMKKAHGAHQTWVNGKPDYDRHTYWLVDNVATDGQTKLDAVPKLEEDGYRTEEMGIIIFVDREQGAVSRLEESGLFGEVAVAYKLLDLTFAFGEEGLWPKSAVKAVEDEIMAHRLLKWPEGPISAHSGSPKK